MRIVTPEAATAITALNGSNGRHLVIVGTEWGLRCEDMVDVPGWEPWRGILLGLEIDDLPLDPTLRELAGLDIPAKETDPVRIANRTTIEERGITALTDNQTYLNIASPTNAQSAAQVKALTRQVNGLIRLVLGRLESAD